MGFSRLTRRPLTAAATAFVGGVLLFGAVQGIDGSPFPPTPNHSKVQASVSAAALGLEIGTATTHLAETLLDGSAADGEESLTELEKAFSLVISGLLENREDPGDAREMTTRIDAYLAVIRLPRLDYSEASADLERIYAAMKMGMSTAELSRKVAKEILCQDEAA